MHRLLTRSLGVLILLSTLALQACATSSELVNARIQFKQGSVNEALQTLTEADVSVRDKLLLHMDTALVAQAAELYEQSIQEFEKAYQLIEELDYVSVRDQSAALVTNDWALRYSGELSERLWIHTFQMVNFLMLEQPEGAAVEARRAVALFEEHGNVLDQDTLTRYLMALSFEAAGQHDSARVEYRKLNDDLSLSVALPTPKQGRELVLLVASGFIQPKLPGDLVVDIDLRIAFPYYPDDVGYGHRAPGIKILADSQVLDAQRIDTPLLPIARSALAERGKIIAARQALRIAAKYQLADEIAKEDPLAGGIAQLLLFVLEQADTRSWETLPAFLSLVRVQVPENINTVDVEINDENRLSVINHSRTVPLEPDSTTFRMIRLGTALPDPQIISP